MTSIAIIGRGHLAGVALEAAMAAGHEIRRVVVNRVEPEWDMRFSRHARELCPWVEVDTSGDWRRLVGLDVDLILSVMYDRIIGPELLGGPARVFNLHLGKLPEYRGMRPINWALKNGESTAGVTLHEVDKGIDTGPIVAQTVFTIWPEFDEVRDVYDRAVHAAESILRTLMPVMTRLPAVAQDETHAGYYSSADIAGLGDRAGWTRWAWVL